MLSIPEIKTLDTADAAAAETILRSLEAHRIGCVNWRKEYPDCPEVTFQAAHNGAALFLYFHVNEAYTRALVAEDNGAVWTDSCVEFFLALDDTGYYNFELTASGRLLAGFRKTRPAAQLATAETLASVGRYPSLGTPLFGERQLGAPWRLLAVIPAKALFRHRLDSWSGVEARANLYKCGDGLTRRHYLSWLPIDTPRPDFHVERCFGAIRFEKTT